MKHRKNIYRTYVYDTAEKYVIVLEPQRSPYGYYLLTAYYLNMPGGEKKMKKNAEKEVGGSAIKNARLRIGSCQNEPRNPF